MANPDDERLGANRCENSAISTNQARKPVQVDKTYEGIRGHERHILFHFFTLFMISFFVGVVFIHLSLWMNNHLVNLNQSRDVWHESTDQSTVSSADERRVDSDCNVPLYELLIRTFQYTGNYFHDLTLNITSNAIHLR